MATAARPLLPLLNADEVDADVQRIFTAATEKNYHAPTLLRILPHQPALLKHLLTFSKSFMYKGKVKHRLIELVRSKIAQLNDCHF